MRAALIGAGAIARQHLACLRELPGVEVVAVCDLLAGDGRVGRRAVRACAAGTPTTARCCAGPGPTSVHVTTPPASHFRLACDALEAGAHVVVEKPATATPRRAGRLLDAGRGPAAWRLVENHNYLYNWQAGGSPGLVASGPLRRGDARRGGALPGHPRGRQPVRRPEPAAPVPGAARGGDRRLPDAPGVAGLRFVGPHRAARVVLVAAAGLRPAQRRVPGPGRRRAGHGRAGLQRPVRSPTPSGCGSYGERMQAEANLFETRLTVDRLRGGPKPLRPLLNGLREARDVAARRPWAAWCASSAAAPARTRGSGSCWAGPTGPWPTAPSRRCRPGRSPRSTGWSADLTPGGGSRMRVLVTGANGFLGRHVVAALLRRGHAVRALVRPAARVEGLGWPDDASRSPGATCGGAGGRAGGRPSTGSTCWSTWPRGHRRRRGAVRRGGRGDRAAPGGDGRARRPGGWSWPAASRSTTGAARGGTLDEETPLEEAPGLYDRDGYAIAKAWQERVARRVAAAHGWGLNVLRPGFIWGRGQPSLAGMGQRLGPLLLVIGPLARLPLTHVENCADAVRAGRRGPPRRRADAQRRRRRRPARLGLRRRAPARHRHPGGARPVPYGAALAAVRLVRAASRGGTSAARGSCRACWCRGGSRPDSSRCATSNRRLREVLGWRPPLGPAERLRRTYLP